MKKHVGKGRHREAQVNRNSIKYTEVEREHKEKKMERVSSNLDCDKLSSLHISF
jgi:hypothetical protein